MRLQALLLLVASALLLDVAPSLSVPAQVAGQIRKASQLSSSDIYTIANPAVVTIYSGKQIGSGSILSPDGLVITNHHVVREAKERKVEVKTATGQRYFGRVVAIDRRNDLALLQLTTSDPLPTIRLATPQKIQIGGPVYAIGSPYGRAGTMTIGTLRSVQDNGDLRSQVILNPGNSGGPLLNTAGEMIGVNKAILESERGENTGISIATSIARTQEFIAHNRPVATSNTIANGPSTEVPTLASLDSGDRSMSPSVVISERLPLSGIRLGITVDTQSLVVRQVQTGSPAAMAGLQTGDHIIAINGKKLTGFKELQAFLQHHSTAALFTIRRNARPASIQVKF